MQPNLHIREHWHVPGSVMWTMIVKVSCPVHYYRKGAYLHAELVLANLAIDESPTTRIQPANHRTWGIYSEHHYLEKEVGERERNALWNSTGATTSTVIIGSRMTGFVLRYVS
jgi:hypothetical protein